MKGKICWNDKLGKFELKAKSKVIVRSKKVGYLQYLVSTQKHTKVLKAGITSVEIDDSIKVTDNDDVLIQGNGSHGITVAAPVFTINQRFEFTEQLVGMVLNKTAKSVLITGEGGIGKTHLVVECLKKNGLENFRHIKPSIEDLTVIPEDDEEEVDRKVTAQMNQPKGDYIMIKGHISAIGLFRVLWEHKDHIIVFDDCDSVFKDGTAVGLLKSALDSYEERWIDWRVERIGDSDLPQSFKFNGQIIFISNMPLLKVDEAVRTRCWKVDVSMTKEQRVERMRAVLENVMPDIELDLKTEALNFLSENLAIAKEVNFRALMNLISIRNDQSIKNWKELGKFALMES